MGGVQKRRTLIVSKLESFYGKKHKTSAGCDRRHPALDVSVTVFMRRRPHLLRVLRPQRRPHPPTRR